MSGGQSVIANNTSLLGQNAMTMRDVIKQFQEKEEIEEELREAEALQMKLEEGLKDELVAIEKEYEAKRRSVYTEALDQVYQVSRQFQDRTKDDLVQQTEHSRTMKQLEHRHASLLKEKRERLLLVDEAKEDLRWAQKTMNSEREFKEAIERLCDKYSEIHAGASSSSAVLDGKDLMLDVERDHQLYLFRQAYTMNRQMTAHISREKYNFRDACKDLIRQNYELLEQRNTEVESMEKFMKDLHEDNMKLKASLIEAQRMVREMAEEVNSLNPHLHWQPFQTRANNKQRSSSA